MPGLRDPMINTGDLLTVRVYGLLDFAPPVRVTVDGNIQLPLIGLVPVAGLTVNRAADIVAQRLSSAGMFVNPQVSIQVTEAAIQFATVAGEMHGIIPISGDRRLLDVLAAAGTMPVTASHVVTILRRGVDAPIVVDLGTDPTKSAKADISILAGDKILVSRVGVVYILGAFKTQGAIPLQQNSPLTLMQATALSGGADTKASTKTSDRPDPGSHPDRRHRGYLEGAERHRARSGAAGRRHRLPAVRRHQAVIKSGGINTLTSIADVLLIGFSSGLF